MKFGVEGICAPKRAKRGPPSYFQARGWHRAHALLASKGKETVPSVTFIRMIVAALVAGSPTMVFISAAERAAFSPQDVDCAARSMVSELIANLERQLGVALFDRVGRDTQPVLADRCELSPGREFDDGGNVAAVIALVLALRRLAGRSDGSHRHGGIGIDECGQEIEDDLDAQRNVAARGVDEVDRQPCRGEVLHQVDQPAGGYVRHGKDMGKDSEAGAGKGGAMDAMGISATSRGDKPYLHEHTCSAGG